MADPQPASGTDRDGYPFTYEANDLDHQPPVLGNLQPDEVEVYQALRKQGLSIEESFRGAKR